MNALLVTDLSEAGLASVQGLLDCGCGGFESVRLLHVIDLDLYGAGGSVPQLQEWATAELEKTASQLRDHGFSVEVSVEVGPILESVRKVSDEMAADLIIATNLGKSAAIGRLLGSTAERLPMATKRPVLIERVGHDGERWCRTGARTPFARVLLGVDVEEDDSSALLGSVLRLPGVQSVMLAYAAPDEADRAAADAKLHSVVEATASATAVEVVVGIGNPGDWLLDQARETDPTVLAVGACRHGMLHREILGSVARRVALDADRAVLLLPNG